jgi:Lon protease-like protein
MDLDVHYDLGDFDNICRLFPLPGVVLFPHVVLPLHVFEPRYRQLTEDALALDKLVTIVQWRHPYPVSPDVEPDLEDVACLGRILQHERLPDGRFNFLLLGLKRVRLVREIAGGKLYRLAAAEILADEYLEPPQRPDRVAEMTSLFRRTCERRGGLDPDMERLIESELPLGILTDLITYALGLPAEFKQKLLAETRVDRRAACLIGFLQQVASEATSLAQGHGFFPPPFSAN